MLTKNWMLIIIQIHMEKRSVLQTKMVEHEQC